MTSDDSQNGSESRTGAPASPNGTERSRQPGEGLLDRVLARLGLRSTASVREDIEDALAEGDAQADLLPQERVMLQNVLALRTRRIVDVMVPRADIVAVSMDTSLGDLLRAFRTAGHSRLPVYAETLDDPRGMIHIRDFLDYFAARAETGRPRRRKSADGKPAPGSTPDLGKVDLTTPIADAKILRPVLFVPPSMPALDLLVKMQASRTHMALVIDEYGGTDGLVSIEDIVEIVVGDIEDEHDESEAPMITAAGDGSWLADARASITEVSAALNIDLDQGDAAEDVDTLGGLVAAVAGRLPVRGEVITHPAGIEFEILDADPRRIKRLRIHPAVRAIAAPEPAPLALPAPTKAEEVPPGGQ